MGRYGEAALDAVGLLKNGHANNPGDAWEKSTSSLFGQGSSSQIKSCPRDAFLGLCEAGLINKVKAGKYTASYDNKSYAVEAVALLKTNPSFINQSAITLWKEVMMKLGEPIEKAHNQQMDVVLALFKNGRIK